MCSIIIMKTVNAVKNVVSALSVGKYWVRLCTKAQ